MAELLDHDLDWLRGAQGAQREIPELDPFMTFRWSSTLLRLASGEADGSAMCVCAAS